MKAIAGLFGIGLIVGLFYIEAMAVDYSLGFWFMYLADKTVNLPVWADLLVALMLNGLVLPAWLLTWIFANYVI